MRGASQSNWRSEAPVAAARGPTITCNQPGAALTTPRMPKETMARSSTARGSMMLTLRRVEAVSMARMLVRPPRAVSKDDRVDVGMGGCASAASVGEALAAKLGAGVDALAATCAAVGARAFGEEPSVVGAAPAASSVAGESVVTAAAGEVPAERRAIFISPAT